MTQLAKRAFSLLDQERFARASGDCNPMHVDALRARRTQAGAPVVHGIHLLLWAIDRFAATEKELPPLRSVRAQFHSFVYLDEAVDLVLVKWEKSRVRMSLNVGDGTRAKVMLELGDISEGSVEEAADLREPARLSEPLDLKFESMAQCAGRFRFAMKPEDASSMFPNASRWIGESRVSALAATTYLVGMVCPGLHSIYSELSLKACAVPADAAWLTYRVTETDSRFRSVDQDVAGGGLFGTVKSFVRNPPAAQAGMDVLSKLISPSEFAGSSALIIGGSRGLGELTAKMIAAGGGRVSISYQSGKADADRVAEEIRAFGGECDVIRYDARASAAEQLAELANAPTHAYYFATPAIFKPALGLFDQKRFEEFVEIYVTGFWNLVKALQMRRPEVSCFYPSSVAVTERPAGMTEYSMAKAAGETLCADINESWRPAHVEVRRLPRLPTDQTATVTQVEEADPVETMLPIVREVQAFPR